MGTNPLKNILFNVGQGVGYGTLVILGEVMQSLSKSNLLNYNWLTGHLSDLSLPADATAFGLAVSYVCGNNKYLKLTSTLIPPIIATLNELKILNISPFEKTYDPQDIACYFAGSLMAYGLSKANEKGVFGKISKKVNNIFNRNKKSLEVTLTDN